MDKLREAIQDLMTEIYACGSESDEKTRSLTVRIGEHLHLRLESVSQVLQIPKSDVVRMILNYGVQSVFDEIEAFRIRFNLPENFFFDTEFDKKILFGLKESDGDDE